MGFISCLTNGISLDSVRAIVALGYTIVHGVAKMLNFAHGDVIIIGSYVVFVTASTMGLSPMAGVLLVVAVCTLLGMTIGQITYKPLRGAPPLAVLITAIGVNYLLQSVTLLIFGADTRSSIFAVTLPTIKLAGGEMTTTGETVVTILSCVIIIIRFTAFISESKAGQAMLVASEDRGATTLIGINVNDTIALIFAIGSALAAVASVLLYSAYPSPTPYTGSTPGIKTSVAAVFGGISSIPGAFIGGILLSIVKISSKAYISSQISDAVAFSVLTIVLLVKPTGILGKRISKEV